MSGGGSSGGGSSSSTDYGPVVAIVSSWAPNLLTDRDTDTVYNNPYRTAMATAATTRRSYDPDFYLDGMLAVLNAFVATLVEFHTAGLDISAVASSAVAWNASITGWDTTDLWEAFIDAANAKLTATLLDPTAIDNVADAASTILQDDLETVSISRFMGGCRDVNAVQSSMFVVGTALLQATKDKQVAKLVADLTLEANKLKNVGVLDFGKEGLATDLAVMKSRGELTAQLMHFYCQGVEFKRLITNSIVEALRMSIVAKKEETDKQIEIDNAYNLWKWTLIDYVTRWVASGHGGGAASQMGPNQTQSAIGGAMSGAATGAMIGTAFSPGAGTAIGAGIGGAVGIAASFL